jgi:hypothetical protein
LIAFGVHFRYGAPPAVPPSFIDSGDVNIPSMKSNRLPIIPNGPLNALVQDPANPRLMVGRELNKLASKIAVGRNAAGVHYRSDYWNPLLLGEEVTIQFLREQKLTYNEDFYYSVTKFNGKSIIILGPSNHMLSSKNYNNQF